MYGHIAKLAEAEKKGIEAAGGKADLYQVQETLPAEVLQKMHAPGQSGDVPFITPDKLEEYDAFLLGTYCHYRCHLQSLLLCNPRCSFCTLKNP